MSFHDSPLAAAKERLSIPAVGAMLFPDWKPGKSCKSPFREERNASFSVYDGGRKWKDFGTGEGGDVADFFAAASGSSPEDGAKRLIQMAGVLPVTPLRQSAPPTRNDEAAEKARKRATWPVFENPATEEIRQIAGGFFVSGDCSCRRRAGFTRGLSSGLVRRCGGQRCGCRNPWGREPDS